MKKGHLREKMPCTADFVDRLREAFGKEYIDDIIRKGLRGEAVFYAEENGITLGTPPEKGKAVYFDSVTGVAYTKENEHG